MENGKTLQRPAISHSPTFLAWTRPLQSYLSAFSEAAWLHHSHPSRFARLRRRWRWF
jgi:hypothetical protein